MPDYKVDYFFQAGEGLGAGWIETWYLVAATPAAALAAAKSVAIRDARLSVLSPDYSQPIVRISDITINRDSLIDYSDPADVVGTFQRPGARGPDLSEEPWDGLLIRCTDGANHRRSFIMRGLPVNVSAGTYSWTKEAVFLQAFNAFKTAWLAAPMNIRVRTLLRGQEITAAPAMIPSAVTVAPDLKSLQLTFADPLNNYMTPGTNVQVSGLANAWPVNKNWRIEFTNANSIWTYPGRRRIYGVPTIGRGQVQPFYYRLAPITDMIPLRGARRNTGRPFEPLHGRRSAPVT